MSKKSEQEETRYIANFEKVFVVLSCAAIVVLGLWIYSFAMLIGEFVKAIQ